jgi:hypothetical protein
MKFSRTTIAVFELMRQLRQAAYERRVPRVPPKQVIGPDCRPFSQESRNG